MYNIVLSNETADSLFRDILIQDYKRLKRDTADLDARLQDLKPYEFEDLCNNRRWLQAIATMMEYYLPPDQMKEVLDEATTGQ